jgi:hypothetical protein
MCPSAGETLRWIPYNVFLKLAKKLSLVLEETHSLVFEKEKKV